MSIIDAHQHYWTIGGPGQTWPDESLPRLCRDFAPADLRAATCGVDLAATVLVQSQPDARDTEWMLALTQDDPLVAAVVGWTDLAAPDAAARIWGLTQHSKLRGLRPMLQAIEDAGWILQPGLEPAIGAMIEAGLSFDALVQPRHLPPLAQFASRWPELSIVIDHAAKPRVAAGELDPWRDEMAALAALPNVWCKLSGLRTEQGADQSPEALAPYVEHLLALFPGRLMWGSDWPVLLESGDSYADWLRAAERYTAGLDPPERASIFSGAAARFYRIAP